MKPLLRIVVWAESIKRIVTEKWYYLLERQHHAAEVRQEAEKRFNPVGIRERLLARRNQQR